MAQDDDSDSDDNVLLMVTTKIENDSPDHWYLDTGCSNHMSGRKEWFVDLDKNVKSKVKFADNSVIAVERAWKVLIQRKDSVQAWITDVLYVPNMKNNPLSLG